jgi:DNA-binding CsgD family transcriptional regulator
MRRDVSLTKTETYIVNAIKNGLVTNMEISQHLCISGNTTKIHLHNIYVKYDVDGMPKLVYLILKNACACNTCNANGQVN